MSCQNIFRLRRSNWIHWLTDYYFWIFAVPIQRVHVLVGERIDLPCDVSRSRRLFASEPSVQSSRKSAHGAIESRSSTTSSSWFESPAKITPQADSQYDNVLDYYSSADNVEDGGFLVLWFIDPDRKPVYRYSLYYE